MTWSEERCCQSKRTPTHQEHKNTTLNVGRAGVEWSRAHRSDEERLTFLGGRMAMADLGVIERCCGLGSFSPLRDRLIAFLFEDLVSQQATNEINEV